jgi:hypothetical protein
MIIIKASNIASICLLFTDGKEERYIYINEDTIEAQPNDTPYEELPKDVASEIKSHFDRLFAVPLEDRGQAVEDSAVIGISRRVNWLRDGHVETIALVVETLHFDLPQEEQNELIHKQFGYLDTLKLREVGDDQFGVYLQHPNIKGWDNAIKVADLEVFNKEGNFVDIKLTSIKIGRPIK